MKSVLKINGKYADIEIPSVLPPLEEIFKPKIRTGIITDDIQDWNSVCDILGIHPVNILPYPHPSDKFQEWVNSNVILAKVCEAYNEGVILDYSNSKQEKWYPYYEYINNRFVFGCAYCVRAHTTVGARLSVVSKELVLDMVKKFDKYFIINKTYQI